MKTGYVVGRVWATKRLGELNRELKHAVESEEYERAAQLRDEIKGLEHPQEPAGNET